MRGETKLRYCTVEGMIRPVADFAEMPPKARPAAYCPVCDQPVTLKLGKSGKRAYHAAHKPNTAYCRLSEPESALHFNTKVYLADQLKMGSRLFLKQSCTGWELPGAAGPRIIKGHCYPQNYENYLLAEGWNDVQLEKSLGSVRPDIVLYRAGAPIAAVEVFVTHRVDEEKQMILEALGVPWVEVAADPEIFDDCLEDDECEENDDPDEMTRSLPDHFEIPWRIEKALLYQDCRPLPFAWTCAACLAAPERWLARQAETEARQLAERLKILTADREAEARRQRYLKPLDNKILFARAYRFLKRLGETEDLELFIFQRDHPGPPYNQPAEIYLKSDRYSLEIRHSIEPVTAETKKAFNEFITEWITAKRKSALETVDLTGGWVPEAEFDRLKPNFTNPYKFHPVLRRWVPIEASS